MQIHPPVEGSCISGFSPESSLIDVGDGRSSGLALPGVPSHSASSGTVTIYTSKNE